MAESQHCILVVDDNEMNRDLVTRRLAKLGHRIIQAENGLVALEQLAAHKVDLVLLDLMMPEMSGDQVLEHMKEDDQLQRIPVLMISAASDLEGVVRCIELGAEDYLPKPFNPVLLMARVNACLEKKRLRDQEVAILGQLAEEKAKTEELLHVILPKPVAAELKEHGSIRPRRYENVAVMFSDVVEFTSYCDTHDPAEVVDLLQELVVGFEKITLKHGLQKIKTIGDAFMSVGGLLQDLKNPSQSCIEAALEMIRLMEGMPSDWRIRVGIAVGPVIAGVIGQQQYLFDVWGDTVNLAARLEHLAPQSMISVSEQVWEAVEGSYEGFRREATVRGKGDLTIYDISSEVTSSLS